MLEHNENLGSSVDLVRIKLYLIKPITVAEKQPIATLLIKPITVLEKQPLATHLIKPIEYEAKQR